MLSKYYSNFHIMKRIQEWKGKKMVRVLQIAMVSFVLSLILGLQQCSHEEETVEKKSVVDKKENITFSNKHEIVSVEENKTTENPMRQNEEKIQTLLSGDIEKAEENLTQKRTDTVVEQNNTQVTSDTALHQESVTKEENSSVLEDNESVVIQSIISDIVQAEVNHTKKEVDISSEKTVVHVEKTEMVQKQNKEENESYTIKIYFTEPKSNALEKELAEVKKEKQSFGQKAYEQSLKIKKLMAHNKALKEKISELLSFSKIIREKSEAKDMQMQTLLERQKAYEQNLTNEGKREEALLKENEALNEQILLLKKKANEELNAAKEELNTYRTQIEQMENDLNRTQVAYEALMQKEEKESSELQALLSAKESLEGNLTQKQQEEQEILTHNKALKEKISELLLLSKSVREQLENKDTQLQTLLLTKESLESNLTQEQQTVKALLAENEALKAKSQKEINATKAELIKLDENMIQVINELNQTQAKLTEVMQKEKNESAQIATLLLAKESLENNLTQEKQKEEALLKENEILKEQMALVKKKVNEEHNATMQKLTALTSQIEALQSDLNITQTKYKALSQKEEKERSALQIVMATKKTLEDNLTQVQQNEKELLTKNQILIEQIAKLQKKAKASEELNATKATLLKLQSEYDQSRKALNEALVSKKNLEENLTQIRGEHETVLQKNSALGTELKKLQHKAKQLAVLQKELNITKSAYEKRLQEEKNKENALVEKEQACGSKLADVMMAIKALKVEKNTQVQGLLSGKQTLEEELAALKKSYDTLSEEHSALQQRLQEEQEVSSQMLKKLQSQLEQTQEKIQAIETEKAKQAAIQKEKKELFDQFKLAKVAFKNDSAELTNDSKKRLNAVAETMKKYSHFNYKVQGHTDSIGNPKYNLKLSKMRAKSVKEYLLSQGVDAAVLSSEGYGSSMPVASNKTRKGRLKNRRVVFEIIQP